MFTGIVAERGELLKIEGAGADRRLWIRSELLARREIGNSVAVDGVCLTVAEREGDVCVFDVSAETVVRSTLGRRRAGDQVNLETPLRPDGELGGHFVQGHVDGVGRIASVTDEGGGRRMRIEAGPEVTRYVVEKGSVTVDGVGLTVTAVDAGGFEIALVPHTLSVTTSGEWGPGREVNLEVDVIAKYVERLVVPWQGRRDAGGRESSG